MSPILAMPVSHYGKYYWRSLVYSWNSMTPAQYAIILISVALFGWILMKSGSR